MSRFESISLEDDSGNPIDSHISADGGYHLGVTMEQSVIADTNNSSTTNLESDGVFTGTATSTLGVVGLQWSLLTDQNCEVCIEQSDTGTSNWDISDCWDYYHSKGAEGGTVQALKSYWRIKVTNNGASTTDGFRLAGVLCPIASPLPRRLSNYGNLQVVASLRGDENNDRHVWVNPTNELNVSPVPRLIGTSFDGLVIDEKFWTAVSTNTGTVVQSGGLVTLSTSTETDGTATLTSVRKARFVAGSANLFTAGMQSSTAVADNLRRIGVYDDDNGLFFQLSGLVFSIGTRKYNGAVGVDTLVNSGSFNGNIGDVFTPTADVYYKISIEYTPLGAFFYVNSKLLHKVSGGNYSDTLTLPIAIENNNTGSAINNTFKGVGAFVSRFGELVTNPTSYYHALAEEAGEQLKIGAGILRGIVISNCENGAIISLSDSTTIITPTLWSYTSGVKFTTPVFLDFNGIPFDEGLRLIITANDAQVTVIYE